MLPKVLSPKPEAYFGEQTTKTSLGPPCVADGSTFQDPEPTSSSTPSTIMLKGPSPREQSFAITIIRELNERNDEGHGTTKLGRLLRKRR
jgi:hypothetical protein